MSNAKPYPYQGSQGSQRICPICPGLKLKSVVTSANPESRTNNPYAKDSWDEAGNYIPPAMTNKITATFTCSQGHKWTEQGACY